MTTPDVTYRVVAVHGSHQLPIKDGFQTRDAAQEFKDEYCYETQGLSYRCKLCIVEEKSQRLKYYEFIDNLLENARRELPSEDMVELINDLGVVLDMHFDGIRREVEAEYDNE